MTYSSEVLADSPLVYLRLGGNVNDSSGNGRNGTSGDGSYTTGLLTGDADQAQFVGASTSTAIAPASWMNGITAMTFECWFKITGTGLYAIMGRSNGAGFGSAENHAWRVYINNGQLTSNIFDSSVNPMSGVTLTSPATSYNDSARHHLAITWDGSTLRMYADGSSVTSASVSGTLAAPTSRPIDLGRMGSNFPAPSTTVIDEFAFYNAALSGTRIAAHYAAGSTAAAVGSRPILRRPARGLVLR